MWRRPRTAGRPVKVSPSISSRADPGPNPGPIVRCSRTARCGSTGSTGCSLVVAVVVIGAPPGVLLGTIRSRPGPARAPSGRALPAEEAAQRGRVAHGVPFAVVVEVGVDVAPLGRPLPHPLGPPAQVVVRVAAGVEVAVVRAVQADVDAHRRALLSGLGRRPRRPMTSKTT